MHRNQLQPEAVTVTAALGACASSAKWEQAWGYQVVECSCVVDWEESQGQLLRPASVECTTPLDSHGFVFDEADDLNILLGLRAVWAIKCS